MSSQIVSSGSKSYKRVLLYWKVILTAISLFSVTAFVMSLSGYFLNPPVAFFCILASIGLWLTFRTATREKIK